MTCHIGAAAGAHIHPPPPSPRAIVIVRILTYRLPSTFARIHSPPDGCPKSRAAHHTLRYTFQFLGDALTPTNTCNISTATLNKATNTRGQKKMAFYYLVVAVGVLRALNRGFASYNMLRLTNDLKARLFGIALQSTRYFITTSKGEINQTMHYYLDREFLATLFQSAVDALVPTVTVFYSVRGPPPLPPLMCSSSAKPGRCGH